MAILKHIASKNADYGEAQRYLMFQYDEYTNKPILDENGNLIPREEYFMDGVNCDPFTFDLECKELNASYRKNQNFDEIKSHHYILSFDPKDTEENGLTGEQAQKLGLEYAQKNFPGHQALVCTHTDGNNKSGNIHVHIVINSLRKFDVERQSFMERPCDSLAGYKHHLTKDYLIHLKQSVMDMCNREHLNQVDLLTPAEKKITDREYHAARRGQRKLDKQNQQMIADGVAPRNTKFQTQKQFLRNAIDASARTAGSLEEFQKLLSDTYGITLKVNRGRFSYLHPERNKYITGRQLGTHYEKEYLLSLFTENARTEKLPEFAVLFIKSDLRLVTDLQACVKAQQSQAYAQKVRLSNLKEMAKTVAYVQEHGYDTQDALEESYSSVMEQTTIFRKELKSIEDELREINEQIHYTGQYLSNKAVYTAFCKSKNKGKFRQEHSTEIALYESARKYLKGKSNDGKLPSMKVLKETKSELLNKKKSAETQYHCYRDFQKELNVVRSNVASILGNEYSRQAAQEIQKIPHR